jgi:dnd system-associated protein 4
MEQEAKGSNRVAIEKDVHQLYRDLSERSSQNPESAPFLLMKDVFMWAVALGVKEGKRRPLIGSREQIFRWDQFSQDIDIPALKAIALAETGEVEVLIQEDQILRITEEYANVGIHEIKREIVDQPGEALWNLVGLTSVTGFK